MLRAYQVVIVTAQTFIRALEKGSMTLSQSKIPVTAKKVKSSRKRKRNHHCLEQHLLLCLFSHPPALETKGQVFFFHPGQVHFAG